MHYGNARSEPELVLRLNLLDLGLDAGLEEVLYQVVQHIVGNNLPPVPDDVDWFLRLLHDGGPLPVVPCVSPEVIQLQT